MTALKTLVLTFALGLASSGCGNKACGELRDKICAGKDKATCEKVKAWIDSEMTGPDKKPLDADQADTVCKMILDDSKALDAWKRRSEEELAK